MPHVSDEQLHPVSLSNVVRTCDCFLQSIFPVPVIPLLGIDKNARLAALYYNFLYGTLIAPDGYPFLRP